MKKILVALISVLLLCTVFVGCGTGINDSEETFTIYAEAGYLDKAEIEAGFGEYYKAKTNKEIKVNVVFYEDTDKMLNEVRDGKANCDLILAKDYAAQALIEEKKVQGIIGTDEVADTIPNYENISDFIAQGVNAKVEINKENSDKIYSVPFSFRTMGILYNSKNVTPASASTFTVFMLPTYSGQVALTNDYRALYAFGSISGNYEAIIQEVLKATTQDQYQAEYQIALTKAVNNFDYINRDTVKAELKTREKQVSPIFVDNAAEVVASGKKNVALCWSNEAVKAIAANTDRNIKLNFKIADQGGIMESNSFIMPNKATNKEEAKMFLNYILQDEVSISQMNYSGNASVLATKAIIDELDDTAVDAANYSDFFGSGNGSLNLKKGYYPTGEEIFKLTLLQDMGVAKEDIVGMVNSVVSNTLLIVLLVIVGVIIVGVATFLIIFVTKKTKQKSQEKERMEQSKGYRK